MMANGYNDKRLMTLMTANVIAGIGTGITMIAIPWYMINREGGEELYGYVTLVSTILLFMVSPYLGVLVDRYSRKKVILYCQVIGFFFMLPFALWSLFSGNIPTWQLVVLQIGGSFYYTAQMPALFALCQEVFDRSHYHVLNSTMEVQNQFASMVSGGIASLLIERIHISALLLLNALTYLLGFLLFLLIPYQARHQLKKQQEISIWGEMADGFRYLMTSPKLLLFLSCTLLPFIVVMVGNYLSPIYVMDTLQTNADVLGLANVAFAAGAILAGFVTAGIMKRWGTVAAIGFAFVLFTVSVMVIAFIPIISVFVMNRLFHGWGNAGTRVARNTLLMELIPNEVIGRVNSTLNGIGLALRIGMVTFFTQTLGSLGPAQAYMLLAFILVIGGTVIYSYRGVLNGPRSESNTSQVPGPL